MSQNTIGINNTNNNRKRKLRSKSNSTELDYEPLRKKRKHN